MTRTRNSVRAVLGVLVWAAVSTPPVTAGDPEPSILVMGVWPNHIRFFDEKTEQFIAELRLRHGPVLWDSGWYGVTAHTSGYERLFYITDGLQSVEVVDPARRSVVDELKLSTGDRKVYIFGAAPFPDGKLVYLLVRGVKLEPDRFIPDDEDVVLYDLDARRVKARFRLPPGIESEFNPAMQVSSDGRFLFVFAQDIYQISTATQELVGKIVLSQPLLAGYGPFQFPGGLLPNQIAPDIYYAMGRTTDPFLKKAFSSVIRIDLAHKQFDSFELGPELHLSLFAVSADGKRGYAGLNDLVVVDMESRRVIQRKEDFERGRSNNTLFVSADGKKLYISGVGDSIWVYDAFTLELLRQIFIGGDCTSAPLRLPRRLIETAARKP